MAVVIGMWRGMGASAMGGLIGLAAFTLMHSPDYAGHANAVRSYLHSTIPDSDVQLRTELLLPTALGVLLPAGVKGALCAVLLMGLIASYAANLHQFSSGIIQDIVLPFRKTRLKPQNQIRLLRLTAFALAIYAIFFGLVFKFNDYLVFVTQLMGAVYLAGIGCVVWGGLYWKRSTTAGAWSSLLTGLILAGSGVLIQQYWSSLVPVICHIVGPGTRADWLQANTEKFPINGQKLSAGIMVLCLLVFVIVSRLTCRVVYDMDKLLHRGEYQVAGEKKQAIGDGFQLKKLAGVNENYTKGDRRIAYFTFFFGLAPNVVGLVVVFWNLAYRRWTWQQWWAYHYFWSVGVAMIGGVITTIWFTWGVTRDMRQLFHDLKREKIDVTDDGQFREPDRDIFTLEPLAESKISGVSLVDSAPGQIVGNLKD
jgi:SSS family solute:Na+ symporter